jgi:hypothetical protein
MSEGVYGRGFNTLYILLCLFFSASLSTGLRQRCDYCVSLQSLDEMKNRSVSFLQDDGYYREKFKSYR